MDFTGKIIAVLPIKQGESARGPWKSQEYVLEYYEQGSQYSNKVVFNAFGENVDKFQIQEGQDYTVSVNINAREWQGRWFNDIRAWRVVQANTVAQQPTYTQAPIASAPMPEGMKTPEAFNANENAQSAESSDDLPFLIEKYEDDERAFWSSLVSRFHTFSESPTSPMKIADRYAAVINWFETNMPNPQSELNFTTPFEAIVAVMLSAQCTDKRINQVTPALFKRFPNAEAMAQSTEEELFSYIQSVSYPNAKATHLLGMAQQIMEKFNGEVPSDFELLQTLPGVGRKTANVVCATVFNQPAMPVDTHVFRVAHRVGLCTSKDKTPFEVEKRLRTYIPTEILSKAHHWLLLHGRYVCTARLPQCDKCGIKDFCKNRPKGERSPQ